MIHRWGRYRGSLVKESNVMLDHVFFFVIPRRRQRDIDLALSVQLFVRPDVCPSVRHKLVGAISQRLLQI